MKITCHRVSKNYCHFEGSIDRWKFVRRIDFELTKACWTTILSKSRQKFILITFSTFYQFHLVAVVHVRLATDHYGQKKRPLAIAVPPRREMHLNIQCILSRLICSATLRLIEWGAANLRAYMYELVFQSRQHASSSMPFSLKRRVAISRGFANLRARRARVQWGEDP